MSLTDELFLDNSQCEERREQRGRQNATRGEKANETGGRGAEWLSLVQVNERWKHKEAVWGCGGLNREDWQKQSSSTVGCLNLHRCCYTPSAPHQSSLMISNITQSFVIALEPKRHCSLWLTLLSFNCLETHILCRNVIQSLLGFGKRSRALILAKNWHAGSKIFCLPQPSRGGSAWQPIYRKSWCIVGRHERLNGGTCLRRKHN